MNIGRGCDDHQVLGLDHGEQHRRLNAASMLNVTNCIIHRAEGATCEINVSFNRCDINAMKEGVFRIDRSSGRASLTNSRLHDVGLVCIGSWASCT